MNLPIDIGRKSSIAKGFSSLTPAFSSIAAVFSDSSAAALVMIPWTQL